MGWMILHTYFIMTQESTCIVHWMDEWMILTHILQCDTKINMYSTFNGWINEWMILTHILQCDTRINMYGTFDGWINEWINEWMILTHIYDL
jgi:hypothetical protein